MRLFLATENDLHIFELPNKIEGAFLFPFALKNSLTENLLSIDAVNNMWKLKSNGNVNIDDDGNFCGEILLKEYDQIFLNVSGISQKIALYTAPTLDNSNVLATPLKDSITVGKQNCNINYLSSMMNANQYNFTLQDNKWYLTPVDDQTKIYINGRRIDGPTPLLYGDVIFSAGLKIIWMKDFLKIKGNINLLNTNLGTYSFADDINNMNYSPTAEEDANVPLYNEDDYFFHTPRLRTVIEPLEVIIDAPPENQDLNNDLPFFLSIGTSLTMVASSLMTGYNVIYSLSMGTRTVAASIPAIVLCVSMIIGSVLIPRLIKRYQKKRRHEREMLRQEKYSKYLEKKELQIAQEMKKQSQILTENNISLIECSNIITTMSRKVWEREIYDNDFLNLRLGIGEYPSQIIIKTPEEHFSLDDDNLKELVYTIPDKYKLLNNVPVTLSLLENPLSAFILNSTFNDDFVNGLILQLITYHSALDLKIVMITNEKNQSRWSYLKKLPHCWNDDKSVRFFSCNSNEINSILSFIEKEYKARLEIADKNGRDADVIEYDTSKERTYKNFQPYYLIITDNYSDIKDKDFIKEFIKRTKNLGFSLVMLEKSMKNLPNECNMFAQILEKGSGLFNKELSSNNQIQFKADYNPTIDMNAMASKVASIPIQSKEEAKMLPQSLSFLDIYNVGKIEQLNILNRWQTNNPVSSLQAPIGIHSNGETFFLDLHEKSSGPHGLIAGSTGSGKSEFIITYILSMALNYHPNEVQFVLIDYKGGGLAGAFENRETGKCIPHLAGTITNLDTSEMNRTLVSIESELKRRQEKFNKARDSVGESTMDIYKYQKLYREGVIDEPISHLFIISDEFAELKSQQPDFMNQLISTARIGRSLGVHLILATQKPSGVVNDQIWSNSRFKVCLKVQTRADSNEMLKRPEAASLKDAGRFYLQVGYDEYFDIGQAGWGGAKYQPTERVIKKIDDSIVFVDNVGTVIKSINDVIKKEEIQNTTRDQLTSIVKYLIDLSEKEQLIAKKLWLPSLPENIYLGNLRKKYGVDIKAYHIKPIIGEYDVPSKQYQGAFKLDIDKKGNVLIYGQAGSGKENLISTIVYSIVVDHSPEEVNFYIADFGSETLKIFSKMPQVGDVFLLDESDKLQNLIVMIQKELDDRKKKFADYAGNYNDYCKYSGQKMPRIIIVLNGYESLQETYPRLVEVFNPLFRDAAKYGINFVVSTATANSIRSRVSQNFENKICLQMPQDGDYRDLLGTPRGMFPAPKFGRGIALIDDEPYEFQTALINIKENINQAIKQTAEKLLQVYNKSVPKIPVLPNIVMLDDVLFEMKGLKKIPIGVEKNSLEVYVYDFEKEKINLISSMHISSHIYFLYAIVKEMSMCSNTNVEVIDALGIFKQKYANVTVIQDNFDSYMIHLNDNINKEHTNKLVHLFIGISAFQTKISEQAKQIYEDIFVKSDKYKNDILIVADDYEGIKKIQTNNWYKANVDNSYGIWLGADIANQLALNVVSLSLEDKKTMFPCIGYPIYKGYHMIIKYVVDGVGDKNEK